ncbi:interleukin-17 receptor E [Halichoeres trimaculatus]|uniref:interleukin-17 receptor E n=1 Tax=Halichoeres trimaculatus TaxID=147232 RepID=UPI003D9E1DD4
MQEFIELFQSKMRLCTTVAVLAFVVVFPTPLECSTCQKGEQNDCPVKLTSTPFLKTGGEYSESFTVTVLAEALDESKAPKIDIIKPQIKRLYPGTKGYKVNRRKNNKNWKNVITADVGTLVSVMYSTALMSCTVSCTVSDPVPNFSLSVNQSSKSINVTVDPGHQVKIRWCYLKNSGGCIAPSGNSPHIIDPSQSLSAVLNFPYLLPCVCVEGYYTHKDARRHRSCPFQHVRLKDVKDVWLSSNLTPFKSYLKWSSKCPASYLQISASLCWKQHKHLCTPVLNLTLLESDDGNLKYNTSAVDKHPQMCVQLSLQGSYNISCPFRSDESSWEVNFRAGKHSVFLYFTSGVPAKFSAQLCVLNERGCTPEGQVHFAAMEENNTETRINFPLHSLAERPCVQVWQSEPALSGRRILCPDYTHNRWGMCAFAALSVVVLLVTLGIFIYRITKRGAAGWLSIQRPVLVICSSEQADHISAVCALASILQGELSATVHMALWAQNSQTQAGAATVADLGPLPWLYGQWEAVRKAHGKVLIVWSPEANRTHETWRKERATKRQDRQLNGTRLEPCKDEKAGREKEKQCDDSDFYSQKEPSTVIAPVFTAALACLEGALQGCKGHGVALVYFQGLSHRKDIPKAFRGVPRYCLPQEFRGFIQELGGIRRQTKTDKLWWHCWPRLLSKVLSVWLTQQLAQRLRTVLLQTQGKNIQGRSVPWSPREKTDKTQTRLKLPRAASTAEPGTTHEHEPLHVSPWRVETL